jgi:hypothetical protein
MLTMSSNWECSSRREFLQAFTTGRRPSQSGAAARGAGALFLCVLGVYLLSTGGSLTTTDAVITFDLTKSLVERHSIALSGDIIGHGRNRGADGRFYSQHGIGVSLYGVPFFCAGKILEARLGGRLPKADVLTKAFVDTGSAVAAAASVALFYLFAWHVTRNARASSFAAACLGWGTALWPYSKFGFNQPLATLLLVAAVFLAWSALRYGEDWQLFWAGILVGAAWLTRHEMVLAGIPIGLWVIALSNGDRFRLLRRLSFFAPGILLFGILWGYYNYLRFHHWFESGYTPAFGVSGYAGLLFSPGASVFLYSPIALVGILGWRHLARHDPATAWLVGGEIIVFFAFYGAMDDWFGGRSYGARYLVPLLPFACLPLAVLFLCRCSRVRRSILIVAAVTSMVVQLPGVVVDYAKVQEAYGQRHPGTGVRARANSWTASSLVLNEMAALELVPRNLRALVAGETLPTSADGGDPLKDLSSSLDFWWLYLHWLRILPSRLVGFLVVLLVGLTMASGWLFRRSISDMDDVADAADQARSASKVP